MDLFSDSVRNRRACPRLHKAGDRMTDTEREAWQKAQALQAAKKTVDAEKLPPGHPVDILRRENRALAKLTETIEKSSAIGREQLFPLAEIRKHYGKTEELLMPLLYRYGVTGPSKAIWDADDGIKKQLGAFLHGEAEIDRGEAVAFLGQIRNVIDREEKVLFPLTLRYFTDEEWTSVYRDLSEIGRAFLAPEEVPRWAVGEAFVRASDEADREKLLSESRIELPTGTLTLKELAAIFALLPVDITFIDTEDRLRFFMNEGKVFARPRSALGRELWDCHPPRLIPVIRKMLEDFRQKVRREMTVWQRIGGKPVGVRYLAVYDAEGSYIGTAELVQDFTEALEHFGREGS